MDDNTRTVKMLTLQLLSDCPAEIQELFAEAQAAQEAANIERYSQKDVPGPKESSPTQHETTTSTQSRATVESTTVNETSLATETSTEKRGFLDTLFRRKPAGPPPTFDPDAALYHTLRVATFSYPFFRHRHGEEQGGYVAYNAAHFGWEYFLIKAVRQGIDGVWYHAGHFNRNKNDRIWQLPIRLEPTRFSRGRVSGYLEHTGLRQKPATS